MERYVSSVDAVCDKLLAHLNETEDICLRSKRDLLAHRSRTRKMGYAFDGIQFIFHGKGCTAFNDMMFLDWDLGYRSRWCGIDPWKVAMSFRRSGSELVRYYDGDLVKRLCEGCVTEGTMFSRQGQYYLSIPKEQTFKPDFPKAFDTLSIEHDGMRYLIPRNAFIDRFIRKTTWVYDGIDKSRDHYMLEFLDGDKVVYTIPYDDIGYPENAIKIMSDVILRRVER